MDEPTRKLFPVTPEELEQAVSHAQSYDGRKHFKLAGEIIGEITAAHLVRYLTQSGFVVMKPPPPPQGARMHKAQSGRWRPAGLPAAMIRGRPGRAAPFAAPDPVAFA